MGCIGQDFPRPPDLIHLGEIGFIEDEDVDMGAFKTHLKAEFGKASLSAVFFLVRGILHCSNDVVQQYTPRLDV